VLHPDEHGAEQDGLGLVPVFRLVSSMLPNAPATPALLNMVRSRP
jgi:hypothetical protein